MRVTRALFLYLQPGHDPTFAGIDADCVQPAFDALVVSNRHLRRRIDERNVLPALALDSDDALVQAVAARFVHVLRVVAAAVDAGA